jgi:hypothetical protein
MCVFSKSNQCIAAMQHLHDGFPEDVHGSGAIAISRLFSMACRKIAAPGA